VKEDDGLTVREITAGGAQMLASNFSSLVMKYNQQILYVMYVIF